MSLTGIILAIVAILVNGIIIKSIAVDTTYRMIPDIKENYKITLIFLLLFYFILCSSPMLQENFPSTKSL